jgi:hypothetical protein
MEVMTTVSWSDDRLDDLNGKVDELNRETRTEFRAVRSEMRSEFQSVRGEMKSEFQAVRGVLKAMLAVTIAGFVSLFAAMIGLIATQL